MSSPSATSGQETDVSGTQSYRESMSIPPPRGRPRVDGTGVSGRYGPGWPLLLAPGLPTITWATVLTTVGLAAGLSALLPVLPAPADGLLPALAVVVVACGCAAAADDATAAGGRGRARVRLGGSDPQSRPGGAVGPVPAWRGCGPARVHGAGLRCRCPAGPGPPRRGCGCGSRRPAGWVPCPHVMSWIGMLGTEA